MGMLGTGINTQVLELGAGQRAARHHAAHGVLDDALGETTLEHFAHRAVLDAAGIAGVPVEALVIELLAGELHLVGIDDDDVVAHVLVGGEGRQVLAAQTGRDDRGQTANDETFRVDQNPLLLDLASLGRVGFHYWVPYGYLLRERPPKSGGRFSTALASGHFEARHTGGHNSRQAQTIYRL